MVGIIPAAGLGTRLEKITKGMPKELLPVGGKPMIEWAIHELEQAGISGIVVVISHEKEEIRKRLDKSGVNITYAYQPKPHGLADAIYRCKHLIHGDTFIVSLSDNIFIGKKDQLSLLISVANQYEKSVLGLTKIESGHASYFGNCGLVSTKEVASGVFEITKLWDKKPGYLSTGEKPWVLKFFPRYVLHPSFFDCTDKYRDSLKNSPGIKELDDVPVLQAMAESGLLLGVLVQGRVFDVGNPRGLRFAEEFLG